MLLQMLRQHHRQVLRLHGLHPVGARLEIVAAVELKQREPGELGPRVLGQLGDGGAASASSAEADIADK